MSKRRGHIHFGSHGLLDVLAKFCHCGGAVDHGARAVSAHHDLSGLRLPYRRFGVCGGGPCAIVLTLQTGLFALGERLCDGFSLTRGWLDCAKFGLFADACFVAAACVAVELCGGEAETERCGDSAADDGECARALCECLTREAGGGLLGRFNFFFACRRGGASRLREECRGAPRPASFRGLGDLFFLFSVNKASPFFLYNV